MNCMTADLAVEQTSSEITGIKRNDFNILQNGGAVLKNLIRTMAFWLTRKRICEESFDVKEIRLSHSELSFFCLSTNQIISFQHDGKRWFFRECPKIQPTCTYIKEAYFNFFKYIDRMEIDKQIFLQEIPIRTSFDKHEIKLFKDCIDEKMNTERFQKLLSNADRIYDKIHFSIWDNNIAADALFETFELQDIPKDCKDIAIYFLWNMRAVAKRYRMLFICRGKDFSFFYASRAVASQIVANELGFDSLITPVEWCRIVIDDGNVLFGTLSPAAAGTRMKDIAADPTPCLQRELMNLNVLDAVCYQPDHGPNNYNIVINDVSDCTVCAFDNDNPKTFFPCFTLRRSLSGCIPLVDIDGTVHRSHMDFKTAESLRNVNFSNIRLRLKPYLNELQIAAVIVRIHKLNSAVKKTQTHRPDFLLDSADWNMDSVSEELSGSENTYLKKAITL